MTKIADQVTRLPDGSGFAVASFPLPNDHWLTRPGTCVPPMELRLGEADTVVMRFEHSTHVREVTFNRKQLAAVIIRAGRHAMRGSTMNGAEDDLDPDALCLNLVVGLLGYWTPDGISPEVVENPGPEGDAERRRLAELYDDPKFLTEDLEDRD